MLAGFVLAPAASGQSNPLATPEQRALDSQSLRVFARPEVQAERSALERLFAADPYGATAEGRATLPAALNEILFASVQDSINRDPARPLLQWVWAPAHAWFGNDIPPSKILMPNVDNVFRIVPVENSSHYRITAAPAGPGPVQFSLQVLPALPGESQWSQVIQEVLDADIRKAPDGSFVLTVGPEQQPSDPNHIATTAAAHFLLIRDTIQDWRTETPYRLSVTRLDGPAPAPAPDDAALAAQAASLARQIGPRVRLAKGGGFANAPGFFQGPPNQLSQPKIREGGRWGLSASGHFHIQDDEALVLTLDPIGAKYLAVQLANAWLGSLDTVHHTAALNLAQTRRNQDGTITVVLAAHDPGTANWLDTTGLHDGSIFVRWQQLPRPLAANAAGVRVVSLVKLENLGAELPRVSRADRQAELAVRAAAYARRYAR